MAEDFTINSAQTTENGGNTLDGSDIITVTTAGSISITSGSGIETSGDYNTVIVNGSISTTGRARHGILNKDNNNATTLTGSVTTSGARSFGITNQGDNNISTIIGDISTTARLSYGLENKGNENTTIVSGKISTEGSSAFGILDQGNNNVTTVSGRVTAHDSNGIYVLGNTNITTVTGHVVSNNSLRSAILIEGTDNIINISGTVKSNITSAAGNSPLSTGLNSFTLQEGAIITGPILSFSGAPTLNIDVGAATSYRYTTTGLWSVNDLDGRAFTNTGNIVSSLGTGNSETAADMLFERNRSLGASLARHIKATTDRAPGAHSVWMDMFSGDFHRSQDSTHPASVAFTSDITGLTIGVPIVTTSRSFDLVLSRAKSVTDIGSGQQKINVTSFKIGAFFKDLTHATGWDVAASAMIGRNRYESSRGSILDNTTATGYGAALSANYSSSEMMLGLTGKYCGTVNSKITFEGELHGNLTRESISFYQEGGNFNWEERTLAQATAGATAAFVFVPKSNLHAYFKLGATRRILLGGKQAAYSIDGTTITAATGNNVESYYTSELGFSYKSAAAMTITAGLKKYSTIRNDSGTNTHIGLNWVF